MFLARNVLFVLTFAVELLVDLNLSDFPIKETLLLLFMVSLDPVFKVVPISGDVMEAYNVFFSVEVVSVFHVVLVNGVVFIAAVVEATLLVVSAVVLARVRKYCEVTGSNRSCR